MVRNDIDETKKSWTAIFNVTIHEKIIFDVMRRVRFYSLVAFNPISLFATSLHALAVSFCPSNAHVR